MKKKLFCKGVRYSSNGSSPSDEGKILSFFFCNSFVNLHGHWTAQLWFCASSRPPAVKRIMFSTPGDFRSANGGHNHSRVCRTESDTWTTSSSPCPASRWAITGLPGAFWHTHILNPATSYSHTHYPSITGGVSERECSISLSASRAIHHLYGWRQARWSFFPSSVLYSLNTFLLLLYICLPSLVRPSLCLFHHKPWTVSRSNDLWIFCLIRCFHSMVVSPSLTFLFLAMFTQV